MLPVNKFLRLSYFEKIGGRGRRTDGRTYRRMEGHTDGL